MNFPRNIRKLREYPANENLYHPDPDSILSRETRNYPVSLFHGKKTADRELTIPGHPPPQVNPGSIWSRIATRYRLKGTAPPEREPVTEEML